MYVTSIPHCGAPRSDEAGTPIALRDNGSANGQADVFASYKPSETVPDAARLPRDSGMIPIDYNSYRSAKGFNSRVRFLVLHYTASDFAASTKSLTGPSVSAHYLVPDPDDATYKAAGFEGMRIFNMVDEKDRAWHAGTSAWRGRTNLNDSSLGIEIVNQASERDGQFTFPPFHPQQTKATKDLALNILQRYPDITPTNVVGHADIALGRKSDPGPMFPWRDLHQAGVGAWYEEDVKAKYVTQYTDTPLAQEDALKQFRKYGYDTSAAGNPTGFKNLVRAFQLHFRPRNYDGVLDVETMAILSALVEKYA
jgi:N-acetylmuramoyl-L-alanine amidase